jgi:acid stress-induced BolA-like protein IbaG/YrbA
MALQILNSSDQPDPAALQEQMREAIQEKVPGAEVEVSAAGPGHYEIRVVSDAFDGKNRVQQHQLVYGAIAHLMAGKDAPVHAIDRLECVTR